MNPVSPENMHDFDIEIMRYFAVLALLLIAGVVFKIWQSRLDRLSIFKGANGFEAVMLILFQKIGYRKEARGLGTSLIFRPTLGLIISIPLMAILLWVVATRMMPSIGMSESDAEITRWALIGAWIICGYSFVWIAIFAKIEITDTHVIGRNFAFMPVRQELRRLIHIGAGKNDQTYVLRFDNGRKIRFPQMMSRRKELLALLEAQIAANLAGETYTPELDAAPTSRLGYGAGGRMASCKLDPAQASVKRKSVRRIFGTARRVN